MNIGELSRKDKKSFIKAVEAGLYPYSLQGGGFTFMIDNEGLWWGTNRPSQTVKEEVDKLVTVYKEELLNLE